MKICRKETTAAPLMNNLRSSAGARAQGCSYGRFEWKRRLNLVVVELKTGPPAMCRMLNVGALFVRT